MIVSSGIACGVLLGVIEGVGVLMQRMFAEGNREFGRVAPQSAHFTERFLRKSGPVAPLVGFPIKSSDLTDHSANVMCFH